MVAVPVDLKPGKHNRPEPKATTYYGQPAIKPSLYGWTVGLYMCIGGMSGGAQILAMVIDFLRPQSESLVLAGRALALAGAIIGGILLIIDLHTKQRFYNMLRIFRPTSPMSIGTYVLMGFGFWSLVAFATGIAGLYRVSTGCGVIAAIFGLGMTSYTAALIATTATPLWAAVPRAMGVRFASSAMAAGAAALVLCATGLGFNADALFLAVLGSLALFIEFLASVVALLRYRVLGVGHPLWAPPWGPVHLIGVQLGGTLLPIALWLAAWAIGNGTGAMALAGASCVIAGDVLRRPVILLAGNQSAKRPEDYFRFTRLAQPPAKGS